MKVTFIFLNTNTSKSKDSFRHNANLLLICEEYVILYNQVFFNCEVCNRHYYNTMPCDVSYRFIIVTDICIYCLRLG